MAAGSRTIRLDLSNALYAPLEYYALNKDIGVQDYLRHLIVEWVADHPLPEEDDADS